MVITTGTGYPDATLLQTADWGEIDSHAHRVQFYGDDTFLLDQLNRFVGSALGAGDSAIVIATKAHRDGLAQRLHEGGFDVGFATAQGRYVSLDAADTLAEFMRDGRPDEALFANVVGGVVSSATSAVKGARPRVAAFGEMVALLWAEGNAEAAIELEHLWNDLARTHSFDLRCAYPMTFFTQAEDGEMFEKICGAHTHVLPDESYTSLIGEDERLRAITLLQQKAQALENEIEVRKKRDQELSDAIATRDEFLSVAAHELKTPVTSLRAFAQLLLRDTRRKREISPERLEFALNAIELQTTKLSQLVSRLLDTAQIEAGKLRIEPVRTDLVGLVYSAFAQQQGDADHEFAYEGPEYLEAVVDPVRFEQAITNLLDNAFKFSPQGGTVTVELALDVDAGIRLSVTDSGLGIPSGEREAVFNRFHQAQGERHLTGMGLGLYIARQIVELHGGSISIEEPIHRGSRFVVALPASAGVL